MLPKYYYLIKSSSVFKYLVMAFVGYPFLILFFFKHHTFNLIMIGEMLIFLCLVKTYIYQYQRVVKKHIKLLKQYKYELAQKIESHPYRIQKEISEDEYGLDEIELTGIDCVTEKFIFPGLAATIVLIAWLEGFHAAYFGIILFVFLWMMEYTERFLRAQNDYSDTLVEYIETLDKEYPKGFLSEKWQKDNRK